MIKQTRINFGEHKGSIEEKLSKIIEQSELEFHQIPLKSIIFDPYVQLLCQECINFGSSYKCPPHVPDVYKIKKMAGNFKHHYIVLKRDDRTDFLQNLYDKYNYSKRRALHLSSKNWDVVSYWKFHKIMNSIGKTLELYDEKNMIFGTGGGCRLCRICEVHSNKPCKKPKDSVFSPEGAGIDVYGTLVKAGIYIEIPPRVIFTRVGFVFTNYEFKPQVVEIKYPSNKLKKIELSDLLKDTENELPGKVIDTQQAIDLFSKNNPCIECKNKDLFICDRKYLPRNQIRPFLKDRKCITIRFNNKKDLENNLWKWQQYFQRAGYYDCLSFANEPCWICDDCSPDGCSKTNEWKSNKYGRKELWRCIKYLSLDMGNYSENKRYAYLIFNDKSI